MSCENCPSRREFLKDGLLVLSGLTVLATTGCASGNDGPTPTVSVTTDATNTATFPFSSYPALQNTGGSYLVSVKAASGTKNVYVTRTGTSTSVALNAACTHQGTTLNAFNSSNQTYTCASHGAAFNATGAVVTGPATTALASYTATINATSVTAVIP